MGFTVTFSVDNMGFSGEIIENPILILMWDFRKNPLFMPFFTVCPILYNPLWDI